MIRAAPRRRMTWSQLRERSGGSAAALRNLCVYAALRAWALLVGCFPIEINLRTARLMGRFWWRISPRHRQRALENLRPSFAGQYDEQQLAQIACGAFEHFAALYLVELLCTPRLITLWSWSRYVQLTDLSSALRILVSGRGCIMLTPHFGNYELLGYTIAQLGLPLTAIMRPPDNPLLDDYLQRTRRRSGLSLLMKKGVSQDADNLLASGGTLCFIADQDAGQRGVFVEFFGRPASWYKSIALLAMRHEKPVIVGGAVRIGGRFRYEIRVTRIIQPREWAGVADPLRWITREFAAALEALIRAAPEQYLWMHRRWKSQPRLGKSAAAQQSPQTAPAE